jgi:hypothetical protein
VSLVLVPSPTVQSNSYCYPGPLCNEPVPIPPGEDPNLRMERHLSVDCSVMTGRSQKASTTPRCGRPKCGKLLFAPIQCDVSSIFATHYRSFDPLSSVCRNAVRSSARNIVSRVHTTALRFHRLCRLPQAPQSNRAPRLRLVHLAPAALLPSNVLPLL